ARQLGQPPRDLGLPDAGRPHHDDVLGRDLVAQLALDPLAPPAVAQRDRDRALGLLLPDDVAVELAHDRGGREAGDLSFVHQPNSSMVRLSLVYTQMLAAIFMAASAMARASRSEWRTSARAAAVA